FVTGLAHVLIDLLATHVALRRALLEQGDFADWLDASEHSGFGVLTSRRAHPSDELRYQSDQCDRHRESEQDDDRKLLRRLDEGGMLVAHRVFRAGFQRRPRRCRRETRRAL